MARMNNSKYREEKGSAWEVCRFLLAAMIFGKNRSSGHGPLLRMGDLFYGIDQQ